MAAEGSRGPEEETRIELLVLALLCSVQLGWFPPAREGLCKLQVLFSGAVTSVAHLYPLQRHVASELTLSQLLPFLTVRSPIPGRRHSGTILKQGTFPLVGYWGTLIPCSS